MYSFVIPFPLARLDNVQQTLRLLHAHDPEVVEQSEIVLVCQDRCGKIDTKFAKYKLINMDLPNMQKCKLLNEAVRQTTYDTLVVLDSDRVLPKGYFKRVLATHQEDTAVTTKILYRLVRPVNDQDIIDGRFEFEEENRSVENKSLMRNLFAGNIVLKKSDYWKAGGMDESYIGYGFEDHDMTNRLVKAGIKPVWLDDVELHLYHERLTYGSGDQKKMFLDNGLRYCRKWNLPIPGKLQEEIKQYTKNII